jgi:hypothetical protein
MVNELSLHDMGITLKQKWVREILNFNNYETYGNKGDI